ncbi:MAG: hypothetical protein M0R03_09855 [Novosphingobium sp.]|nr:hypothetical protein [Novosphingobium sp.]
MQERAKPSPAEEIAAAMAWWRDAGIEWQFSDEPADWLDAGPKKAPPIPEAKGPAPAQPADTPRALMPDALPTDLAAFREWWMAEPALDAGRTTGRVPPRGPANPALMVIVEQPEEMDSDRLLSGPQGKLLDAMLAAMGIPPADTYFASALPRAMPLPDWAALARDGLGEVLARHMALVGPRRIMALGGNILPLMGNDPPLSPDNLPQVNHEGRNVPVFAARGLAQLLERPRWKAALWKAWLDWSRPVPPG